MDQLSHLQDQIRKVCEGTFDFRTTQHQVLRYCHRCFFWFKPIPNHRLSISSNRDHFKRLGLLCYRCLRQFWRNYFMIGLGLNISIVEAVEHASDNILKQFDCFSYRTQFSRLLNPKDLLKEQIRQICRELVMRNITLVYCPTCYYIIKTGPSVPAFLEIDQDQVCPVCALG